MTKPLDLVPVPALPLPSTEYNPQGDQQFKNVLRLFFNRIVSNLNAVLGTRGGQYISNPYGAFSSLSTQSVAAAATPTRVSFDATDFSSGVSYTAGNGIHVAQTGLYNLQFSMQLTNNDTQLQDADVWLRKDGVDVANTASVVTVTGTHGGHVGYQVLAANFYLQLNAGEYVEFWWAASSTQVTLNYLPAITTPFASPGAPSVIATVSFVSRV